MRNIRELYKDVRLCPKCRMGIAKTEGCNKMTCTNCGQYFCFACGKAINGYDHFKQVFRSSSILISSFQALFGYQGQSQSWLFGTHLILKYPNRRVRVGQMHLTHPKKLSPPRGAYWGQIRWGPPFLLSLSLARKRPNDWKGAFIVNLTLLSKHLFGQSQFMDTHELDTNSNL